MVVARKLLLSRARKQAVPYANFCNLILADHRNTNIDSLPHRSLPQPIGMPDLG